MSVDCAGHQLKQRVAAGLVNSIYSQKMVEQLTGLGGTNLSLHSLRRFLSTRMSARSARREQEALIATDTLQIGSRSQNNAAKKLTGDVLNVV